MEHSIKTFDGIEVKEGDTVYVLGSTGIHPTKVLPPVTSYVYFGNIEVKNSFSTQLAAEKFKYKEQE